MNPSTRTPMRRDTSDRSIKHTRRLSQERRVNVNDGIVCASVKQERDGLSIWLALEPNQAGLQIKWDGEGAVLLGESGNDKQKKKRAMNVHGNLPTVTPLT